MRYLKDLNHPFLSSHSFTDVAAQHFLVPPGESQKGAPPAWVLDLDSTLFSTAPRTHAIFYEYLRGLSPQSALGWRLWERLREEGLGYVIPDAFAKALGVPRSDAAIQELWQSFLPFWLERFFNGRYLHHDHAYAGAAAWVQKLHQLGHEIVYLTGRDRPRLGGETKLILARDGFPVDARTHLFMKGNREEGDAAYKQRASEVLAARFHVSGLLDNEPENLLVFAQRFKTAHIVFFHSVMSPRVPAQSLHAALEGRSLYRFSSY